MNKTIKQIEVTKTIVEKQEVEIFELSREEMEVIHTIVGNSHIENTIFAALKRNSELSHSDITQIYNRLDDALR